MNKQGKYKIITFGCQMNVHESEKLAGILRAEGYTETEANEDADIIVFNTCCIRDNAEKRATGNIGALKQLKKSKPGLIIAVCGCMPQQEGAAEALHKKFPFISLIFGTHNTYELSEYLKEYKRKHKPVLNIKKDYEINECVPVYRTSGTNAWVNIMYGCNNFCTYCIVPFVRGRERSRDYNKIIEEINLAVKNNYKEITLLGQNVNSYNVGGVCFAELLRRIDNISGDFSVSFMTSHPKDLNDEVIEVIAKSKHLTHKIHLPVQSGSNAVLAAMNRKYTKEHYLDLIEKIRKAMPDCEITTDIMIGFPTETEQDFLDTLDIINRVKFNNAFTFIYSPRKGTPAAGLPQLDAATKKRRITTLIKHLGENKNGAVADDAKLS